MQPSTIQEAIADYTKRTGETVECDEHSAVKIIDNNFMIWRLGIREGVPYFFIDQTYAKSFPVFVPFIREVCKAADITTIVTATTRNPRAHQKKWSMVRVPEHDYTHEGRYYYVLKSHISNLR